MSGIFKSSTVDGMWCVMDNGEIVVDGVTHREASDAYSRMVFERGAAAAKFLRESFERSYNKRRGIK